MTPCSNQRVITFSNISTVIKGGSLMHHVAIPLKNVLKRSIPFIQDHNVSDAIFGMLQRSVRKAIVFLCFI